MTQSISRSTRPRSSDSTALRPRSHRSSAASIVGVLICRAVDEVAGLARGTRPGSRAREASRPLASRTLRRPVTSWLISRIARIGFSIVRSRITTPSSIIRSTRSQEATLSSVVVSLMLESPTITCRRRYFSASACGSSRVLMIGRRPGGGAGDALPDVLGALGDAVRRAARGLGDLAGAHDDLPGHQERDQHVGQAAELAGPADQVVLVAAVGVAGRVGVVLEQVDLAGDALVVQPLLGVEEQPLEDPLPRLVVGDQLDDVVALRGGVLGVAADVEVEPGAVAQEDVAAAAPADDLAEQVAGHLVGAQPALALERARDAVLVLDAEDPPVHTPTLRVERATDASHRCQPACRPSLPRRAAAGPPAGGRPGPGPAAAARRRSPGRSGPSGRRGRRRWRRCRAGARHPPRPGWTWSGPRSPSIASSRLGREPAELPGLGCGSGRGPRPRGP